MFTFNLTSILTGFNISCEVQSPKMIKQAVEKLNRCPSCHFLVFDNYWSDAIGIRQRKLCPTCGEKL